MQGALAGINGCINQVGSGRGEIAVGARRPAHELIVELYVVGSEAVDVERAAGVVVGDKDSVVARGLRGLADDTQVDIGVGAERGVDMGVHLVPLPAGLGTDTFEQQRRENEHSQAGGHGDHEEQLAKIHAGFTLERLISAITLITKKTPNAATTVMPVISLWLVVAGAVESKSSIAGGWPC